MDDQLTFELTQSVKDLTNKLYNFSGTQERVVEALNLLSDSAKEQMKTAEEKSVKLLK